MQLGRVFPTWHAADRVLLMGSGTHLFADAALAAGLEEVKLISAEGMTADEVFEQILGQSGKSALVMGLGNAAGLGLDLARYFRNRAAPEEG